MFRENYFDVADSKSIKAIFAILILVHHIFQVSGIEESYGHTVYYIFTSLGYISVSVFFFISGYGLTYKDKNRTSYDVPFLTWAYENILPIYFIYLVLTLIYSVVWYTLGKEITIELILKSLFLGGKNIIKNGWYFQVIILLYAIYGFSRKKKYQICILSVAILSYFFISFLLHRGFFWYVSVLAFVVGCIYSQYRQDIDFILRRYHEIFVLTISILVLVLFYLCDKHIFFRPILATMFPLFVMVLCSCINCKNKLTGFVGNYYLSIYAMQGIPILIYIYLKPQVNLMFCFLFIALSTLLLSVLINPIFVNITKYFKKNE